MNTFTLEIWDDEGSECLLYTVRWEEAKYSETDKFFLRFTKELTDYKESAQQLAELTQIIANKYGATDDFIDRHKNKASALPPKPKKSIPEILQLGEKFPLRLYCYRISEKILILFNGGIKDERTDQKSDDISFKFQEVQILCKRIEDALQSEIMIINHNTGRLEDYTGSNEIWL